MMQNESVLVLASASPRRQELIRLMGVPFRVCPANVEEQVDERSSPQQVVETLSLHKALAVAKRLEDREKGAVVIGSDTVVVLDGQLLGKPANEAEARETLKKLQGRTHEVYSGIACVRADGKYGDRTTGTAKPFGEIGAYRVISESAAGLPEAIIGHTVTRVTFRAMSDEEIESYVKTGEPLDKAGSYGVQGWGAVFVEKIEGDFYSVMGLPVNLLYRMLDELGINGMKSGIKKL